MWEKLTLTTASNTARLSFAGRGSIYAEGTFGSGSVGLHIVHTDNDTNAETVATGFLDSAIDGTTIKSIDAPSGHYELNLAGSTGATVDVYYNDQYERDVQ